MDFPRLSDLFFHGHLELGIIAQVLDPQLLQEISSLNVIQSNRADTLIWKLTPLGNFTLKSAWDFIRSKGQPNSLAGAIWKQASPPSANLIGWKILKGDLPMDCTFRNMGISMVSKCVLCCNETESVQHVFCDCVFAKSIWYKLSSLFGLQLIDKEAPLTRIKRLFRIFKFSSLLSLFNERLTPSGFPAPLE